MHRVFKYHREYIINIVYINLLYELLKNIKFKLHDHLKRHSLLKCFLQEQRDKKRFFSLKINTSCFSKLLSCTAGFRKHLFHLKSKTFSSCLSIKCTIKRIKKKDSD